MAAATLYTPEILALATSLAEFGSDRDLPFAGSARSANCGSTIDLSLSLDAKGAIGQVAVRSRACAIGQAAAALFARAAPGKSPADISAARSALQSWLAGEGPRPDWQGIAILDAARDYPSRHGAIMLAWNAACDALCVSQRGG